MSRPHAATIASLSRIADDLGQVDPFYLDILFDFAAGLAARVRRPERAPQPAPEKEPPPPELPRADAEPIVPARKGKGAPFDTFLEEMCVVGPAFGPTRHIEIVHAYEAWCKAHGLSTRAGAFVGNMLEKRKIEAAAEGGKGNRDHIWAGIALRTAEPARVPLRGLEGGGRRVERPRPELRIAPPLPPASPEAPRTAARAVSPS